MSISSSPPTTSVYMNGECPSLYLPNPDGLTGNLACVRLNTEFLSPVQCTSAFGLQFTCPDNYDKNPNIQWCFEPESNYACYRSTE